LVVVLEVLLLLLLLLLLVLLLSNKRSRSNMVCLRVQWNNGSLMRELRWHE
jgi:hypothetical protein